MGNLRMPQTNTCIVAGRIVRDFEPRQTSGGKTVLDFTIANDQGFGDKKTTNWIGCTAWADTADRLIKDAGRGRAVLVHGRLKTEEYETKAGAKQTKTKLVASFIELLDWPDDAGRGQYQKPESFDDADNAPPF